MNTKQYTKLPKQVNDAITQLAQSNCLLVPKRSVSNNAANNCHYNVREQVQQHGGKIVNGWLLNRSPALINIGQWHWAFHSVWQTEDGELYDITYDPNNTREFSTFVPDATRTVDLTDGTSYNDVAIMERKSVNEPFMQYSGLNYGEAYWTSARQYLPISTFDGQYRLLRPEFAHNYVQLERDYGIKVVNGRLSSPRNTTHVPASMLFKYSLSLRN